MAAIGTVVLSGATMIRLAVQLAILPVLARFVGPHEYGLVSLALPFVMFANVFAEGGMSNGLGRQHDVDWRLESTVFWIAGGIGAVLALVCSLLAWPMSLLLHEPRLTWLIAALSPILILNALTSVSNGRIIREGRFHVFAGGDLISTAVSATIAIYAASHGAGAWSLVAQQLALWICKFLWVTFASRTQIRLYCRPREAMDLAKFGLHSIGSTLSDFASRNVDNVIVGAVLGASAVGYYAMAYQIIRIPDLLISGPLYLYIFSAFARARDGDGGDIRTLAVSAVRLAATALAPLFCGLALLSDLAVPLVLGDKWDGVIVPLAELSAAGFAFSMCYVISAILMARGLSGRQLRISLAMAVASIGAVAIFAHRGVNAVCAALAVATLAVAVVYIAQLALVLKARAWGLLDAFRPAAAGLVVMILAVVLARRELAGVELILRFPMLMAIGAASYGVTLFLIAGRSLQHDVRAFAHAHSEKPAKPVDPPIVLAHGEEPIAG